jgi:hypothetical protein
LSTRVRRLMCFSCRRRSVKSRSLPRNTVAQQHEHVALEPAVCAVAMAPACLQVGRGALVGAERMHGEVERGEILGMDVLGRVRAEHLFRRVAEDAADRIAAEGELAVAVVLPDPVLRRDDDIAQLLLEGALRAARGCVAERAADGRHEARHVRLEHVVIGAALERFDRALLADRARKEYEWRMRHDLASDVERGQPVESRQREIGENQVGTRFVEGTAQRGLGVDALPVAREPTGFELTDGDFRLRRHVFDHHQSHWLHVNVPRERD